MTKPVVSFLLAARYVVIGLLLTLLGACATHVSPTLDTTSRVLSHSLEREGRFAISVNTFNGERQAVQGRFIWVERAGLLRIDLLNPLGTVLARVQVFPHETHLQRADGSVEKAAGPDALVEQLLGTPVPVTYLREWLQGQTSVAAKRDEAGRVEAFDQDGWRVRLQRYDSYGPRFLQLHRNDTQREISVRLIIDQ